nr:translation initiation factor IF-2 N-terminal domain-containing protein [Corynebacterium urinipleomorphum]
MGEKTRVFVLAKALGMPSKDLVVKLNELGLVKVAQSSLSKAETEQLLDALEAPSAGDTASADTPGVYNAGQETVQTEQAVATDDKTNDSKAEEKIRHRVRKDVENEINQIEEKVEADLLTDVEPEVTPAPDEVEEAAGLYAPVFKAAPRHSKRRARRAGDASISDAPEPAATVSDESDEELIEEPKAIKGSSRLEAQRRRRSERREEERKRSRVVSQAEFLARRESVERTMVVRERKRHDGAGTITQVGVLEDGLLVEHFVDSDENASMIGNIYLGRVQNVLPSMEAAFIDIGQGRNGVLYAGEVDWKSAGLGGRSRRIEQALKSGDQVLVQVTKDPVGHKGARLTTQISLAGRFLVYVPGGRSAGISRKLPAPERKRLKDILVRVVPGKGGTIIRTAAEGAPEEAIAADVNRLHSQWEAIQEEAEKEKASKGAKPVTLYEEPRLLVKVVRDLFNEDFDKLVIDGKKSWNVVHSYVQSVAPDLLDRLEKFDRRAHEGRDAFDVYRVDEQIQKALSRTVWLPSGGTLVIDRTEAMTVIDVNTGKFTGSGGSLEETVTSNNLEAAEEIVRQLRLRDIGGMIIIDFIDMILPENQELVLRRLKEALGRDRTRHQVSEVTSLGLVQLTRKRLGTGLVETFSTKCEHCDGRGIVLTDDPVDPDTSHPAHSSERRKPAQSPGNHPAAKAMEKRSKKSAEELADAVVAQSSDAETEPKDPRAGDQSDNGGNDGDQPRRSSSRRRGRRGSGRGRGKDQSNQQDRQEQQEEKKKQQEQPRQTYEEAVEEFERSPRRKRSTRGNSVSDYRPDPKDFEDLTTEDVIDEAADAVALAEEAANTTEQSGHESEGEKQTPSSSRGTRRRRRATRRTQSENQSVPKKEPKKEPKREQRRTQEEPAREASISKSSRGRRRATRKSR